MTTPTGALLWGQGANYDAVEDRGVIAVLAQGQTGLVFPPAFTALPGLVVGIGPWGGVVDCGDRTSAIVGSRDTQSIGIAAGGGASRRDVIWADIDVDAGLWTGRVYPEGGEAGRPGLLLGTVIVPPGANNSSVMDLIPARARRWGGNPPANFAPGDSASGTGWTTIARDTIPGGEAEQGTAYEFEVWGNGTQAGASRRQLNLRTRIANGVGVTMEVNANSFATGVTAWRWHLVSRWTRRATDWQSFIHFTWSATNEPVQAAQSNSATDSHTTGGVAADPAADNVIDVQAQFPGSGGNPSMVPRIMLPGRKIAG